MNNTTNNGPQQTTEHNIKNNDGAQQMTGHNKLTRHNKQMANISQQTNNGGGTTSQLTGHNSTVDRVGNAAHFKTCKNTALHNLTELR